MQPLRDDPVWAAHADGSAIAIVEREAPGSPRIAFFTVTKLSPAWDTLFTIRMPYEPVPTTTALVDSILANTVEGRLGMPREVVYAPRFRPPVTAVSLANDGSVWLNREFSYGPDARWTVVDSKGQLVGEVGIPRDHRFITADARYVWTTIIDENDVPFIIRYRIVKPTGGS
jgi:hypothetical protein